MPPERPKEELVVRTELLMGELVDPPPPHPCTLHDCQEMVPYDDEPWCFAHSPATGSSVPGYSWRREHGLA